MRKKGLLITALFFVIFGVWIGVARGPARAAHNSNHIEMPAHGFLWTDTFGWISLNCVNDWNQRPDQNDTNDTNECNGPGGNYRVIITLNLENNAGDGTVTGYGWSPHLGLVCFGTTCGGVAPNGLPASAGYDVDSFTPVEVAGGGTQQMNLIRGFARVEAHTNEGGNGGWIDLAGSDGGAATPRPLGAGGVAIQFVPISGSDPPRSNVVLSGSAWQRNTSGTGVGWLYFGDPPPGNATTGTGGGSGSITYTPYEPPEHETGCGDTNCCLNGVDDDRDQYSDCLDIDCKGQSFYSTTYNQVGGGHCGPLPANYKENGLSDADCFDTVDNDFNGTTDCADQDCQGAANCSPTGEELTENIFNGCYNGIDDDGNGLTDCNDPKCASFSLCNDPCLCPAEGCPKPVIGQGEDPDQDGIKNIPGCDNCNLPNPDQRDTNANGKGDACDPVPWLQTKQGSLYIKRALVNKNNPPPPGQFTATYCIFASGAIGPLTSEQCPAQPQLAPIKEFKLRSIGDVIALWSGQNKLRGRFDVKNLQGKSGVTSFPNAHTINATIYNNGAELFIVENGDLEIKGDLSYGAAGASLQQLPSVGFLVLNGDIVIDPSVKELVGTFITTGTFRTGTKSNGPDQQLIVRGLVAAKKYDLQRKYASLAEGAEVFIYDGRAVLNPPPGLADFVKGLPQFRTVAPK